MRKVIAFAVWVSILFCLGTNSVQAIYDPLSQPNNHFGIHIADTSDVEDAALLVNSNGGDWGYVTLVITKGERDPLRWQKIFDQMRRLHLIPIVRIATAPQDHGWEKPNPDELDGWLSFLNSLNWVIKNRYVIIGNEPNQSKEWGGEINPEEYAYYLKNFSQKLKATSQDFFILPAGLDASAPNSKSTMDEALYLKKMLKAEPNVFDHIDGWTSHSYPNPAFSGSENGIGRGSVRTFVWELSYLRELGVEKDLKVIISETGWAHNMNRKNLALLDTKTIGKKMTEAFVNAWSDKRIVAVTPFILSYKDPPFDVFSWKDKSNLFYQFYYDVQAIKKESGKPIQETSGEITSIFMPAVQIANKDTSAYALVKNTGQAIWDEGVLSIIQSSGENLNIRNVINQRIEPGETGIIKFKITSPDSSGFSEGKVALTFEGKIISPWAGYRILLFKPIKVKDASFFDKILRFLLGR